MNRDSVLEHFGDTENHAIKNYQISMINDLEIVTSSEMACGNYTIGINGIKCSDQRTGTSHWIGVCRVLGDKEFAKRVLSRLSNSRSLEVRDRENIHRRIERLFNQIEVKMGLSREVICGNSRSPELAEARGAIAWICSRKFGLSYRDISRLLIISKTGVAKAVQRGAELQRERPFIIELLIS